MPYGKNKNKPYINYLSRDFLSLKEDLIKYAKYGFTVKESFASQMIPEAKSIEIPKKLGFINYINSII